MENNTILIVDDEMYNLISLSAVLKSKYTVYTALDAQQGLDVLGCKDIHVIISDYKMPNINGIDFLRKAKALKPEAIAIIMTAHNDEELIVSAVNEIGIYHFIPKPIHVEDFKVTVDNAAEHYTLRTQNRALINDLKQVNQHLEIEILNRTSELQAKNVKLQDSLIYAQGIQKALLPLPDFFQSCFADYFVLYKPKDFVSGDFYWGYQHPDKEFSLFVVGDCTGHGVPGALLSMLGIKAIDDLVQIENITSPSVLLNQLHSTVRKLLKQNITGNADGMDVAVILYERKAGMLRYAGAKAPIILFKNGEPIRINGDNKEIGGIKLRKRRYFSEQVFEVASGDVLYMFSDGFTDQFGGAQCKKFMAKRFLALLNRVQAYDMPEQKKQLWSTMVNWMQAGDEKQLDDMTIVGLKF